MALQAENKRKVGVRENNRQRAMARIARLWGIDEDFAVFSRRFPFKGLFAFLLNLCCQKTRFNVVPTSRLTAHCTDEFLHHK